MCHGKDTVIYFAREKEIESRKGERGGEKREEDGTSSDGGPVL